jgi:phage terminase Nu1 subunit (DNA packaging protein)
MADAALTPIGKKGKAILYDSAMALRAIFGGRGNMSPADRLTDARCQIAEIDLAERRGEMIRGDAAVAAWERQTAAFRSRMLAIPSKIAGQFAPPGKLQQAEEALTTAIYEALAELVGDGDVRNT